MRLVRTLLTCAVLLLAPAAATAAAPPTTFTSVQDGFSVDVPGTMELKILDGDIRAFVLISPPTAYLVTSTPMVEEATSIEVCHSLYDGMKGTGTEPGMRWESTLSGLPALEAELTAGGAPGVARCAYDGRRAYMVAFLNAPSVDYDEAARLFDSFRITP